MTDREKQCMDAAQDALDYFKAAVSPDEQGEVPPSALLAGLRLVAEYEGWDWDKANAIAVLHGPLFAYEISDLGRY